MNGTPMKIEVGRDYSHRSGLGFSRVIGHAHGLVLLADSEEVCPVMSGPEKAFLESYIPFVPHTEASWHAGFVSSYFTKNETVLACYLQDSNYGPVARPMFRVPDQRDAAIASLRGGDKITIQADGSVVDGDVVYKQTTIVVDGGTIPVVGIGVAETPSRPAPGVTVKREEGSPIPWDWFRCDKDGKRL